MSLLLLLSVPGPTIIAPPSARSPYLEINIDGSAQTQKEIEDLLQEHPEVSSKKSGSLGGLTRLSFRGSRSLQNRMTLDGLPLSTGFDGLQAWRLIEPALLSHLRIDSGGSRSGLTPLGGHVELKTTRGEGPWFQLIAGSNAYRHLALGHRDSQIRMGASLSQEQGDFTYFDNRGTLFHTEDDRQIRRQNNQRQRINSLFSSQNGAFETQLFFARLSGGVPGPGHRQTQATAESINLGRLSLSHRKSTRKLSLYLAQRSQENSDPRGEWLMGMTRQETTQHNQMGLLGRWRKRHRRHEFRLMINGEWNALQGPQVPDDTGTFQMDLHWKHPLGLSVWLGGMHRQLDLWQTSRSQRAFSPGLAYQHPSTNFLIRLQSMARLPSLLETYGRSFFLQGNADLKKERGLGVDLLWRSAHGRVSLYGRQVEDLIEWDQNAQFSSRPRNRAYAQVIGFSVFARRNGFQLGYRLQNTWAFDDEIDTQADELAGEPIHRLRLHWKGRWAHLSYGVHWDLKSGYYLDRANLRPVAPSYPVDLEMAYPLGQSPFRLSIRLSNLLNQRQHEVILLPSDHRVDLALADQAGYPLPGRRWFIGLETRR